MKKLIILTLLLSYSVPAFAVTSKEVADKVASIAELREQVQALSNERHRAELALVKEYNVSECNSKRNQLATDYADLIAPIQAQITTLEAEANSLVEVYKEQ